MPYCYPEIMSFFPKILLASELCGMRLQALSGPWSTYPPQLAISNLCLLSCKLVIWPETKFPGFHEPNSLSLLPLVTQISYQGSYSLVTRQPSPLLRGQPCSPSHYHNLATYTQYIRESNLSFSLLNKFPVIKIFELKQNLNFCCEGQLGDIMRDKYFPSRS